MGDGRELTSSGDRAFRVHMECDEPLFALREEQKELESMLDADLTKQKQTQPTPTEGIYIVRADLVASDKPSKKTRSHECNSISAAIS